MLWSDCCRVDHAKQEADRLGKKRTPPHPVPQRRYSGGGTRLINVGIGSLAAGEVSLDEVIPPPSQRESRVSIAGKGGSTKRASINLGAGAGDDDQDDLMPFQKTKSDRNENLQRRKSVACMEGYLDGQQSGGAQAAPAGPVSGEPIKEEDEEDEGQPASQVPSSGSGAKFRKGSKEGKSKAGKLMGMGQRALANARDLVVSTNSGDGGASRPGTPNKPPSPAATTPASSGPPLPPPPNTPPANSNVPQRAYTKDLFAEQNQVFICLDWDDTLFPTTYVRDDLGLNWQTPLRHQRIDSREKAEIGKNLQRCADNCCHLLKTACNAGKVVLVTLARAPWVNVSCDNFFPTVGALLRELRIPVVYAQEIVGAQDQVEYDKVDMSNSDAMERYWAGIKGKAIARELNGFYSQYAGQSWKNVISIGDSDFERLGTQQACKGYMKQTGISRMKTVEVSGHMYKVRTKTFKMLDQPSVEELTVELAMLLKWLPLMVKLDSSFDVNLNDLEDPASLRRIERTLRGQKTE